MAAIDRRIARAWEGIGITIGNSAHALASNDKRKRTHLSAASPVKLRQVRRENLYVENASN